jgi:DNA-binding transcriptional LysR family regulator
MSTASVSKALARLEHSSGVKLLHRSTHAVSLTDDGEQLIESARDVVRAARIFSGTAAARNQDGAPGWVRIAAPVALMRVVLAPLLAEFSRVNPTVRLDVRASNELIDLAKGAVDVAIRSGPLERIPGHSQITWFKFPWVVCASPAYLDGRDTPVRPVDLATHRLIGFRNQRTGQVRPWSFRPLGNTGDVIQVAPEASCIFDDGDSAWSAVLRGAGIACAPLWLAADDLRAGRVVELLRDWRDIEMTVSLLRRDRRLAPERVDSVMEYLRRQAPRLADLM